MELIQREQEHETGRSIGGGAGELFGGEYGISDARMVDSAEGLFEAGGDGVQLTKRDLAFVEFSLGDAFGDDAIDELGDARGTVIGIRPDDRLGRIREHDDGGLAGLRPGAGVAVVGDVEWFAGSHCPPVEEGDKARPVMLRDEVADGDGKAVVARDLEASGDMRANGGGAGGGLKRFVRTGCAVEHIFDVEARLAKLANVVVEGAYAGEQGIGGDPVGGGFREAGHGEAVLVRARGLGLQPAQERVVRLRKPGQGRWRSEPKVRTGGRYHPPTEDARSGAAGQRGEREPAASIAASPSK